jgi:hypothetical protein
LIPNLNRIKDWVNPIYLGPLDLLRTRHDLTQKRKLSNPPEEGFILTHFLTVADVKRSAEFYLRILGGEIVREGDPTIIEIANSWIILNVGGGPTSINQP